MNRDNERQLIAMLEQITVNQGKIMDSQEQLVNWLANVFPNKQAEPNPAEGQPNPQNTAQDATHNAPQYAAHNNTALPNDPYAEQAAQYKAQEEAMAAAEQAMAQQLSQQQAAMYENNQGSNAPAQPQNPLQHMQQNAQAMLSGGQQANPPPMG